MKKRIALAIAFATAISIGNMVPAFATKLTAPGTVTQSCVRAGGTLSINDDADDGLTIKMGASTLSVVGEDAECNDGTKDLLLNLTTVEVNSNANVTFDLEGTTNDTVGTWAAIAFKVRTSATLIFTAGNVGIARYVSGSITEEAFTFGSLAGTYYAAAVTYTGHSGTDVVDGSTVTTTALTMTGAAGDDTLKGGALDDTLTAGVGKDKLYGNAGDDSLTLDDANDGSDQGWGGAGNDTISAENDAPGTGDPNEDVVAPGDGYDLVNNYVAVLTYVDSSVAISLNLLTGAGTVTSSAGNDTYTDGYVTEFDGSAFADSMIGGADDDVFNGGAGADTLLGLAGDDDLNGAGGADVIKGGEDYDTLAGASGADKIYGGTEDDQITGGGGDDILYGGDGNDTLKGNKGTDQTWGGQGKDDICSGEVMSGCEYKK